MGIKDRPLATIEAQRATFCFQKGSYLAWRLRLCFVFLFVLIDILPLKRKDAKRFSLPEPRDRATRCSDIGAVNINFYTAVLVGFRNGISSLSHAL